MSVIATALKHLMAAGVTGDALVNAIADIEKAAQPIRSSGAERTAKWRAKRHGDVTVTVCDEQKGFDKEIPHTPLEITSKKITTTRGQKSDLPDDWEPDAKTWALADELGFTSQEAWDQLDRMRDWAKNADGTKGRKSDWNAAFRNWIKRAADDKSKRPTQHGKATGNSRANNQDILDAIVREAERREAEDGGGSLQDIDARAA